MLGRLICSVIYLKDQTFFIITDFILNFKFNPQQRIHFHTISFLPDYGSLYLFDLIYLAMNPFP